MNYFNIYLEGLALMDARLRIGMASNEGKLEYRPKVKKVYKLKDDLRHIPLRRKSLGEKKGKEFYAAFDKEFGLIPLPNLDDID